MKRLSNTYKILLGSLVALVLAQCAQAPPDSADEGKATENGWQDERGFDPLELPQDLEIIPARYPRTEPLRGQQSLVETDDSVLPGDSMSGALPVDLTVGDTLNNQAYRVQLLSSRVYKEAREGARVAEEIFDQPVYVDYEVPNYKVRVGNFPDRVSAEDYQQRARAAGYANAWVVVVSRRVHEVAPLYKNLPVGVNPHPAEVADSTVVIDDGE